MSETIHVFEEAGLGRAPFKYLGCIDERHQSCDYCGHEIRYNYMLESSDGRYCKVGSECILKAGDAGLIEKVTLERRRREREKRRIKAAEKAAKERAEREAKAAIQKAARETRQARIDAAWSEIGPQIETATLWLVEILDMHPRSRFCVDLSIELSCSFKLLKDRSPRCVAILQDIYAKAHGRTGSMAYNVAFEAFKILAEKTDRTLWQLRQRWEEIEKAA